jgi:serine/threonine protein kinase
VSDDAKDFVRDSLDQLKAALADRYLIERELGRGGMAIVYLARDLRHNRPVAVKVLLPEIAILLGPDRFLREIEITAQLQHPHIVPVHDSGNEGGTLFYVMPFVEGESLRDRLAREQQLPLDDVVRIVHEVSAALSYAHTRGVIHRDIKPENILLSAGHAQVADFGIARAVSAAGLETLTQSGAIIGTPAYMAPEQAAGLPDIDGRADIYALAAVAHEALIGNRGDPMAAVRTSENLLTRSRPDVSVAVARALSAPLALERELRPGTVDEWVTMLDTARRGHRVPAWAAVAIAVVAVMAVVGGWMLRGTGVPGVPTNDIRRIGILPLTVAGASVGEPTHQAIQNAVHQQLLYLPDAELLADTVGATELLRMQATMTPDSALELTLQILDARDRTLVAQGTASGAMESLPTVVSQVLADAYGAQIAEATIGWDQALPSRTDTWFDYLQAERRFKSGDYAEAMRLFDRVLEREPAYAPAHYKRLLTEVLRNRPTRAMEEVERSLAATGNVREALDPTTRDILEGYTLLLHEGDLDGAIEQFARVAEQNPKTIDAWFVLGFLKVNFPGLLREPPTAAWRELERAYELDPNFAAVSAQLARLAWLQGRPEQAGRYVAQYLALDSTSATAEVLRLADSAARSSAGERIDILVGLEGRSPAVLELIAFVSGAVDQSYQDRLGSRTAIEELWRKASTPTDRTTAFRMYMASLIGTCQLESADSLLGAARRRGVPAEEIDVWLVLPAVTIDLPLGTERERAMAADRLAERSDDPTAIWLAARWYAARHDATRVRALERQLEDYTSERSGPTPLARSLLLDLRAHSALAAGDTASAASLWREAVSRHRMSQVPLAPVASLWPLELSNARVALAAGRHDEVFHIEGHFRYMAGFIDQVAWPVIWPLVASAYRAAGDPLGGRDVANLLEPVFRDANGLGVPIRDSLLALRGTTGR